jgi:hypothetical protein
MPTRVVASVVVLSLAVENAGQTFEANVIVTEGPNPQDILTEDGKAIIKEANP